MIDVCVQKSRGCGVKELGAKSDCRKMAKVRTGRINIEERITEEGGFHGDEDQL